MKEGFLKYGGYNIHHVKWGDKGHKVLLIHSMGMDGHSMDALAESLKKEYQVLSLTILDHGDSDPPKGSISLPDHAEVMRGCYAQLGFTPSVLIGHSVGGMMGMVLAAEHPDEFEGLVLVDIAPYYLDFVAPLLGAVGLPSGTTFDVLLWTLILTAIYNFIHTFVSMFPAYLLARASFERVPSLVGSSWILRITDSCREMR